MGQSRGARRLRLVGTAALVVVALVACGRAGSDGGTTSAPSSAGRLVADVSYGPDPLQSLDLYLPVGDGPFPVVLYLHSGGWVAGSHQYIPDFLVEQVSRGIAVVSADYRLASRNADGTPVDTFPSSDQDVDRAIRFVRANAARWALDPDRIVVAGASAGGHLALLAAAAPGRYAAPDLPAALAEVSPRVQGVMAFVAPSDLVAFAQEDNELAESSLAIFLACPTGDAKSCNVGLAREASPATHLDAAAPPAYFAYGSTDAIAPPITQGLPIALQWAAARNEALSTVPNALVQFHVIAAGHNLELLGADYSTMEGWLDAVLG